MKKNLRASVTKLAWNGIVDEINKVNNEIRELENGPRDKEGGREKLLGCRKRRARLGKKAKEVKKTYNHFQRYLNSDFWEITEEEAVRLIVEKTHGCDETGRPNSLHPLTVGSRGTTKDERITGYLHDLVEDTSVTWEDLEKHFVPKRIIEALKLLTHDKTKPYGPCMRTEREDGVGVIFVNYKYQDMRAGNEETLRKVISEIIQKEKAADRSGESKKIPIDWDQVKLDLTKSVVLGLSVYNGGGNIIPIICNSSRTDHEVEMAAKRTANFVKTLVAELKKGGEDE